MISKDIFTDRRANTQHSQDDSAPCRRAANDGGSDQRPWWLKVNYLNRQLQLIETGNFHKIDADVTKK